MPPLIKIQIQAADGFVAKVVNSPENKGAVQLIINNTLTSAATGIQ